MWWGPVTFPDCVDCKQIADPLATCKTCRLPLCDDCATDNNELCPDCRQGATTPTPTTTPTPMTTPTPIPPLTYRYVLTRVWDLKMNAPADTLAAEAQAAGLFVLQTLDPSGHLNLIWDPTDTVDVANARKEVERLKAAGYTFFAVVGATGEDEVAAGNGELLIKHISSPLDPPTDDELPPEPGEEASADPEPLCSGATAAGKPCGRKAQPGKNGRCWQHPIASASASKVPKAKTPKKKPGRRSLAMRPMAGG